MVMNQQTEWDFRASMYKHKGEFQEEEKIPKIYNSEKYNFDIHFHHSRKSGKQILFSKTDLPEKTVLEK